MIEQQPDNRQSYILCVRNAGWDIDCKVMQTLAAEKGILMSVQEYYMAKRAGNIKVLVKMFLDLHDDPMKDRSHIIKIKTRNKKSDEPLITNNYSMEQSNVK